MLDSTKRTLATLTAATFLGAGGWAIAQSGSTTTMPGSGAGMQQHGYGGYGGAGGPGGHMGHRGPRGEQVAGADLAKITAAVTAKLPGATVERAMKAPDGTFHAHVIKSDGAHVHVALNSAFAVTGVDAGMRRGGMHGRGAMPGAELTATDLAKVTSAVTAKLPGATVKHAKKAPDGTYHAHVVKKDGSHAHVTLNAAFAVSAVEAGAPKGEHRRGGPGGPGGRPGETALTGEVAAKVKAAALAKVPGATVDRVETDADSGAYEAHVTKSDGSQATVKVDKAFNVTGVEQG